MEIVIKDYKKKDKDQVLIYQFINEVAKKKRMRENQLNASIENRNNGLPSHPETENLII